MFLDGAFLSIRRWKTAQDSLFLLVEVAGFEPASENTVGSASTSLSRVFDVGPRAPTGRIARPQASLDVTRQAEGTPPGLARLVHAPRTPRA